MPRDDHSPPAEARSRALRPLRAMCRFALAALTLTGVALATRAQEEPAKTPHPLAQQMFAQGAMTCAAMAHKLATLLSNGNEVSLLQVEPSAPDQNIVRASLLHSSQHGSALTSIALAPRQAHGCGASYESFTFVASSCEEAASKYYPTVPARPLGKSDALYGSVSPRVQYILMRAGSGCVIVQQEMVN